MTDDGTTTITTPPPGWYSDPHGAQRWWDGQAWTSHVAEPVAPVPVAAPPVAPAAPAAPAVPTQVAPPLVAPAPLPPSRSQDLLPAAAPASPRRSPSSLRLPTLPPLVWVGAAAALVAIVGGAFYLMGSGDEAAPVATPPAAVAPVLPAKSGAILTAKQAAAALPKPTALGAGWTVDPNKSVDLAGSASTGASVTVPAVCGKAMEAIDSSKLLGVPVARAAASFQALGLKRVAGVLVSSYKVAPPLAPFSATGALLKSCSSFTYAAAKGANPMTLTRQPFGQGALMISTSQTLGAQTLYMKSMVIREGHNLVEVATMSATAGDADIKALATATLARLPH
jgi:hypothetical protein